MPPPAPPPPSLKRNPACDGGIASFQAFPVRERKAKRKGRAWLGSQVGELQHYYVSPGSYLWTQGLHNCVHYAFFLFVGIVEGGGEVMATCFDSWGVGLNSSGDSLSCEKCHR